MEIFMYVLYFSVEQLIHPRFGTHSERELQ
ncbi:hypothetical protein N018_14145 [Pseudomonas syringae CC1557]|uniref:Uncharacterized protein n=1 Tax=Pseudomonas syringae CC1557 TaxID=1357279 RepID=W0N3I9_PSESX|nr:hypothetical protein N018_14145 [Pseudomonas syringae CC1557]